MATITAGDFRNGKTFEMDGKIMQVVEFQHVKPGKGAAFVRTKMKNVVTGAVTETSFNPTAKFEEAFIERKDYEYSYNDGDLYYFMDQETYDMVPVSKDMLDDSFKFIKENTPVKLQNRHVKRAAAEVIDDVNSFRCLIEAIGQSSGRRLIQQTENIEAGKAPRVLRRLTLRVIKVRRARNHGAHKFPFEIRLSPGAEHLQDF